MKPTIDLSHGQLLPARIEDAAFVLRLLTTAQVRQYLCDDVIPTESEVFAMLANSDRQDAEGLGLWIICAEQKQAVGLVGLAPVSGPLAALPQTADKTEPVIALDPAHFGRGLATAALLSVLGYARDDLGLLGLVAAVDIPNEASHRLMTATGFDRCGRTRGETGDLILYKVSFSAPNAVSAAQRPL